MGLTVYGGGGKPEEEKTVTAGTSVIEVNPSSGKVMKKVTVNPTPTESKSVTPTTSELTVTPSEGKHLSQVVVGAVEDLTPEVTAQTPVITQIAEKLGVTITTPSGTNKQILQCNNANLLNIKNNAKKEGAYVWKKSKRAEITITQITDVNPTILQLASDDIDLSQCTIDDFNGFSGTLTWTGGSASFSLSGTVLTAGTITFECTYDQITNQISIAGTVLGSGLYGEWDSQVMTELIGYVVDNNESKYPDGGTQDGYWYEKVGDSVTISGTFTPASTVSSYNINNPFGSAKKVKSVLCYTTQSIGGYAALRYKNNMTGKVVRAFSSGQIHDDTANMEITDETVTFVGGLSSVKYIWEVIGNE